MKNYKDLHNKKITIIGNGFRAMMTAYFCFKYTKNVTLVTNNKDIHGVMSPIEWEGGKFDKGYQFFDGFSFSNQIILEKFVGKENLYNFGYGASTYTNKKIYNNHAIPYWPHQSWFFVIEALIGYLKTTKRQNEPKSYQD